LTPRQILTDLLWTAIRLPAEGAVWYLRFSCLCPVLPANSSIVNVSSCIPNFLLNIFLGKDHSIQSLYSDLGVVKSWNRDLYLLIYCTATTSFRCMFRFFLSIFLRDAVLARYVLSSHVRLSVRLSVRHKTVLHQND